MHTWTPKVCRIMDFWALLRGLGPLCCILLGSRQYFIQHGCFYEWVGTFKGVISFLERGLGLISAGFRADP